LIINDKVTFHFGRVKIQYVPLLSWLENIITEINNFFLAEMIYTLLSKWSFLTCSDHVQQVTENNFPRKIEESSQITEKNHPCITK
jgi:hypothetical protein